MSIGQVETIDNILWNDRDGELVLTIVDNLPWDDEERHALALEQKVNAYLSFVGHDQHLRFTKGRTPDKIVISLIHNFPAKNFAESLFARTRASLAAQGFAFSHQDLQQLKQAVGPS